MTTVYVLMESEQNEGGEILGVYSSEEKAREEAPEPFGPFYHEIVAVRLDGARSRSWPGESAR